MAAQTVMDLMQQVWRIRHADGADADSADTSESQAEGKTSQGSTVIPSQGDHTAATTLQGSSSSGGGGRPARLNLKPLATSTGSALAGSATIPEWHGIPPPPPRNLPHGWTARYDEKEKKYAYAHGVTAQEQWDFPADTTEPPQFPPDEPAATTPSTAIPTATTVTATTTVAVPSATAMAIATVTATATAIATATAPLSPGPTPKRTPPEDLVAEDVD